MRGARPRPIKRQSARRPRSIRVASLAPIRCIRTGRAGRTIKVRRYRAANARSNEAAVLARLVASDMGDEVARAHPRQAFVKEDVAGEATLLERVAIDDLAIDIKRERPIAELGTDAIR